MSVLIVTMPGDYHAHATRWAIERLGGVAKLIYPADLCDGARWTFDPSGSTLHMEYRDRREIIELDAFRTVWMRRPQDVLPQERLNDRVERAIAEEDFGILARSIYSLLSRGRFTVNRRERSREAGMKPLQFAVASEVGLTLPRTVIGNSPEAILDFYEATGGNMVFKPFRSPVWQTDRGPRMVPTTRVSREMLTSSDLAGAPGIFQECVAKQAEVRATIMGRTVLAWEKRFDDRDDLDVDWRFMFRNARHARHQLPKAIEDACFALLDELGLVFGCFDFVIDEEGRYFFLEVNPQGQWLWGDVVNTDLHQLEGMARFLQSEDPRFRSNPEGAISLSDYSKQEFDAACRSEAASHYGNLMAFTYHRVSFAIDTAQRDHTVDKGATRGVEP